MAKPPDHETRMTRARDSLIGLSVGDAFGEAFFVSPAMFSLLVEERALPRQWRVTDDTIMAMAIVETLNDFGAIDEAHLATRFADRFTADKNRGYGPGAFDILGAIADGEDYVSVAGAVFGGTGSMGNGGAMRVAPLGGYFAGELERAAEEAAKSCAPTHRNQEGIAGAVAIAVAGAALAADPRADVFAAALPHTPEGPTRAKIERARELVREGTTAAHAARVLGNGSRVISSDTVPFCLAMTALGLTYEEAMWQTVAQGGDRDTTCAIVGGLIALRDGVERVPAGWRDEREPLPW